MFTPLDLAERRKHTLVVDYLRGRHEAKSAAKISADFQQTSRESIEEQLKTGNKFLQKKSLPFFCSAKLRRVRARIKSLEEDGESAFEADAYYDRKERRERVHTARRRRNFRRGKSELDTSTIRPFCAETSRRSSSATASLHLDRLPKATSTSDLHKSGNSSFVYASNPLSSRATTDDAIVVEIGREVVESTIHKIVVEELKKQNLRNEKLIENSEPEKNISSEAIDEEFSEPQLSTMSLSSGKPKCKKFN